MLEPVPCKPKLLDRYERAVGPEPLQRIADLAAQLQGARILHVNATSYGGGVAEILYSLAMLMNDVGIDAGWRILQGSQEFFEAG